MCIKLGCIELFGDSRNSVSDRTYPIPYKLFDEPFYIYYIYDSVTFDL